MRMLEDYFNLIMKELLIFRSKHEVEKPFKFYCLAYLALLIVSIGLGIGLTVLNALHAEFVFVLAVIGLLITSIVISISLLIHSEAKKLIRS